MYAHTYILMHTHAHMHMCESLTCVCTHLHTLTHYPSLSTEHIIYSLLIIVLFDHTHRSYLRHRGKGQRHSEHSRVLQHCHGNLDHLISHEHVQKIPRSGMLVQANLCHGRDRRHELKAALSGRVHPQSGPVGDPVPNAVPQKWAGHSCPGRSNLRDRWS